MSEPDDTSTRRLRAPCRGSGKVVSNLGGGPWTIDWPWCKGTGRFEGEPTRRPRAATPLSPRPRRSPGPARSPASRTTNRPGGQGTRLNGAGASGSASASAPSPGISTGPGRGGVTSSAKASPTRACASRSAGRRPVTVAPASASRAAAARARSPARRARRRSPPRPAQQQQGEGQREIPRRPHRVQNLGLRQVLAPRPIHVPPQPSFFHLRTAPRRVIPCSTVSRTSAASRSSSSSS